MSRRSTCIHSALSIMLNNNCDAEKQGLILLLHSFAYEFCWTGSIQVPARGPIEPGLNGRVD